MCAKVAFVSSTSTTWPRVAWLTTSRLSSGPEYMFSIGATTTASRVGLAGGGSLEDE